MKKIKVGIVGAGTVGAGLAEILSKERQSILRKTGLDIELSAVCDKNTALKEKFPDVRFVSDYNDLVSDPSVSVIAELIGGKTVAYDVVKAALAAGKTVVTANKALLSEKGEELFAIAEENGIEIGFEASVGGTIPVIRSIRTSLAANQFDAVYGILNGTTNFILTKMEEEHLEYSSALKEAQRLGFAEADP
ncbi:MAG TPA: homoserine dehydrogenase, partial [Leptospiraceae bacterium]|nr:homoserine dehydrogenase [Leptospiraceae bacterium]